MDDLRAVPTADRRRRPEGGFALIAGLIFLMVMSVLGITMMGVTRLETLMAGGAREAGIAFQAAEAALRDGEGSVAPGAGQLCTLTIGPNDDGSGNGRYYGQLVAEPSYLDHDWAGVYESEDYPEMQDGNQPRYVIKHVGDQCVDTAATTWRRCLDPACPGPQCQRLSVFRITGWGTSRDATSTSLLQTHFACFTP